MLKYVSTKVAEKIVKMIEPTIIAIAKEQQSPKPQKKTHFSSNDFIVSSLRKELLSEQEIKQREFKLKQRDQEFKENNDYALKKMEYELKKKPTAILISVIALVSPAVMAVLACKNYINNAQEKDKEIQINELKAKVKELKAQANDSKVQVNELKAQDAKNQAELNRYKKQEEERQKQSENSFYRAYSKVFGSGRR